MANSLFWDLENKSYKWKIRWGWCWVPAIEESLNLDLPFFSRLSTMLDQMGLQAVKQGQITDNWQKRGPWLLIEDNQSLSCDHASPFTSGWALLWRDQWQIQPLSFAAAGTFPIPAPALYHQTLFFFSFFFFKLGGSSLTPSQTLTLNKVSLDLSVCLQDGNQPKIFSAVDGCLGISHWFRLKNTTAGKYKQMKRPIYSGRGCCFSLETTP